MHLLLHSTNYAPEPTGTGKVNAEMCEWLVGRGYSVTVLTAQPHYPGGATPAPYRAGRYGSEHLNGVRVLRCPIRAARPGTGGRARIVQEASFGVASIPRWFARVTDRPDVVMAVSPPIQMGIGPSVLRTLRGTPWIYHVQDLQADLARNLGMTGSGRIADAADRLERRLTRRADAVTTITPQMAAALEERSGRTVGLVRNWANLDALEPAPADMAVRRELGCVSDDDFLVMHCGTVGAKQGLDSLLHAARETAGTASIRYAIVGEGAAKADLERQAAEAGLDNVVFAGTQPRERLGAVLRAADVHVITQREEAADLAMPSRLPNILAVGRPFVAQSTSGTALGDAAAETQAGWLAPPGDPAALARQVSELASGDRERLREAGAAGRSWAEEHLHIDRCLAPLEELIQQLAAAK